MKALLSTLMMLSAASASAESINYSLLEQGLNSEFSRAVAVKAVKFGLAAGIDNVVFNYNNLKHNDLPRLQKDCAEGTINPEAIAVIKSNIARQAGTSRVAAAAVNVVMKNVNIDATPATCAQELAKVSNFIAEVEAN